MGAGKKWELYYALDVQSKLPMKIKVFMWLTFQDRLPTGGVLKKRNWKGEGRYVVCKVPETRDHIFFHCPLARFVWACAKEAFQWDRVPTSLQDFLEGWMPMGCVLYNPKMLTFVGLLWSLWNVRNKMTIEGVFIKTPAEVIFKFDSFLQKWRGLFRAADRGKMDGWKIRAKGWMEEFLEKVCDRPPTQDFL